MKTQRRAPDMRARILIVDDHPLMRVGLANVINQQEDVVVCGEAGDAPSGLAAAGRLRPDAVIADISLDVGSGLDLIKDLHAQYPGLPVLALSVHHENLYAERAIHAGARGYVMKQQPVEAVLSALRKILAGHIAVSENIVSRLIGARGQRRARAAPQPAEALSDRELDVFRMYGHGLSTRQIAQKLRLAVSTIESYRVTIKHKLGYSNATELVAGAARFVAGE